MKIRLLFVVIIAPDADSRSDRASQARDAAYSQSGSTRPARVPSTGRRPRRCDSSGDTTRQSAAPEKIALGQRLFFDGRLSADGSVACSTCHDPARAFTDGKPTSMGIEGRLGQRNAPTSSTPSTTRRNSGMAARRRQEQAALPIVNPVEMGQPSMDAAATRIEAIATTSKPSGLSSAGRPGPDLVRAIASYERTQVAFDSPFDHFIAATRRHRRRRRLMSSG